MILIIFINVCIKNAWNYKFTSTVSLWPVAQACSFNQVTRISQSVLFRPTPSKTWDCYLIDSKLPFHQYVDYVVSPLIKLWGLIQTITNTFSSLDCMFLLYFTLIGPQVGIRLFLGIQLRLQMPKSLNMSSESLYPCVKTVFHIKILLWCSSASISQGEKTLP
jgi:hypothetical protein